MARRVRNPYRVRCTLQASFHSSPGGHAKDLRVPANEDAVGLTEHTSDRSYPPDEGLGGVDEYHEDQFTSFVGVAPTKCG